MKKRNPSILFLVIPLFLLALAGNTYAKDRLWKKEFDTLYTKNIENSVNKGLEWLAEHQNDNGSWTNKIGYKLNESVEGHKADNVGVTAIAGLSFISAGNFPGQGEYGEVVKKALEYVLSCSDPATGYISCHGSRMYEHGFATLFLAELYGMTGKKKTRRALEKAVQIILDSQNREGGWRYQPRPDDADLSVTVTIVQSLRSAKNVGIYVPGHNIEKAMNYVKKCYRHDGAFYYQTKQMSRASWALTAAGVVSLHSAGHYKTKRVRKGIKWLWNVLNKKGRIQYGDYHYFYGHFYTSQALYQAGWNDFRKYYKELSREFIVNQRPDGSWIDIVGQSFATAMSTLILQLPTRYLPIFQK